MAEIIQPAQAPVGTTGWKCLQCIIDRKVAEMAGADVDNLPWLREAITMMNGMVVCYQHIAVQRQSPLAMPNGAPVAVPPGLMNGHS